MLLLLLLLKVWVAGREGEARVRAALWCVGSQHDVYGQRATEHRELEGRGVVTIAISLNSEEEMEVLAASRRKVKAKRPVSALAQKTSNPATYYVGRLHVC